MNKRNHSKESREKISIGLKKYYSTLTKEERSALYNTVKKGILHPNSRPIGSTYESYYRMVKIDDNTWIPEHVYVVEMIIGRKLNKGECVHHIDENGLNNDPNNLYLFLKRGLHTSFTQLVKYRIIDPSILKSNLEKIKEKENGDV
jgi:hypothetical protein